MAAAPLVEEELAPVVLRLLPEWVPLKEPPAPYHGKQVGPTWGDVWDWVKEHNTLPAGRPVDNPWLTPDEVQYMIDVEVGSTFKALASFVNQLAEQAVDDNNMIVDAIDRANSARVADFGVTHQRIANLENRVTWFEQVTLPAIVQELAAIDQRAQVRILQSEARTQAWATENILKPLMETIFDTKTGLELRDDVLHQDAINKATELNNNTIAQVMTTVAPMFSALRNIATQMDDCVMPMCETMGPKTDLGKALKALNFAATAALIASIAAMDRDELAGAIAAIARLGGGILADLEHFLVDGAGTLGATLAGAG